MHTARPITTARQLLEAGEIGSCELVQGKLIMMTPAGFRHGRIVLRIASRLALFADEHNLGVVTSEDTGYRVARHPDTVYAPDVGFVSRDRVPPGPMSGYFEGAPDLAIEVLSPANSPGEIDRKRRDYFAAGCRLVWVVDPDTQTATRYRQGAEPTTIDHTGSIDADGVIEGFSLPMATIFAGL